jgi:hypothetical protein
LIFRRRCVYLVVCAQMARIPPGSAIRGEVCAGSWVYHYVHAPQGAGTNASLTINAFAYSGAIDFAVKGGGLPFHIMPPFGTASFSSVGNVKLCGLNEDSYYYVAVALSTNYSLLDSNLCSTYDITAHITQDEDEKCQAKTNEAPDREVSGAKLRPSIPVIDEVTKNEFNLYSFTVGHGMVTSNIFFEVKYTLFTFSSSFSFVGRRS